MVKFEVMVRIKLRIIRSDLQLLWGARYKIGTKIRSNVWVKVTNCSDREKYN
jgi:hypothetical protein